MVFGQKARLRLRAALRGNRDRTRGHGGARAPHGHGRHAGLQPQEKDEGQGVRRQRQPRLHPPVLRARDGTRGLPHPRHRRDGRNRRGTRAEKSLIYTSIPSMSTGISIFDVPRFVKSHANCSK